MTVNGIQNTVNLLNFGGRMKFVLSWLVVVVLVCGLAIMGFERLHQNHLKIFLIISFFSVSAGLLVIKKLGVKY